jgi:hypothetical protein
MTRIVWSAHSSKKRGAGERGGLLRRSAERAGEVRHLAGMMGDVAGDRRPLTFGVNHYADYAAAIEDGGFCWSHVRVASSQRRFGLTTQR